MSKMRTKNISSYHNLPFKDQDLLESKDAFAHGATPARLEAEDVLVGAVPPIGQTNSFFTLSQVSNVH